MDPTEVDSESEVHGAIADMHASLLMAIIRHRGVRGAIAKARAAGVDWAKIIAAIVAMIPQILAGGGIPWSAIIQAILALIGV